MENNDKTSIDKNNKLTLFTLNTDCIVFIYLIGMKILTDNFIEGGNVLPLFPFNLFKIVTIVHIQLIGFIGVGRC